MALLLVLLLRDAHLVLVDANFLERPGIFPLTIMDALEIRLFQLVRQSDNRTAFEPLIVSALTFYGQGALPVFMRKCYG